jgi:hypothetical protein
MDITKIKFNSSQATSIYHYKNLRLKILKCNANIQFNKQCLQHNITPKYARIKIPHTSHAAKFTQSKVTTIRLKDEIKFLYRQKDFLNKQLYYAHLQVAHEWGNTWPLIQHHVHDDIQKTLNTKYQNMKKKLQSLSSTSHTTNTQPYIFHPRVTNKTTIPFTDKELTLLQKGLKYNLPYRPKNWIQHLALETETATSQLPSHEQDYIRALTTYNLKRFYNSYRTSNSLQHTLEYRTLKTIQTKL